MTAPAATELPPVVRPYRRTPAFDQDTMPAALRREHSSRAGVWGRIGVIEGRLRLTLLGTGADLVLDPQASGLVAPEQPHRAEPLGAVRFLIEFCAAKPPEGTLHE
ncbi:MAG: DUF1971 domain-containing protein [Stellaceae bacterium]